MKLTRNLTILLGLNFLFSPLSFISLEELYLAFGFSSFFILCFLISVYYILSRSFLLLFNLVGRKTPFSFLEFFFGEGGSLLIYFLFVGTTIFLNGFLISLTGYFWVHFFSFGLFLFLINSQFLKQINFQEKIFFFSSISILKLILFGFFTILSFFFTPSNLSEIPLNHSPGLLLKIFFVFSGFECFFALAYVVKKGVFEDSIQLVLLFAFLIHFFIFLQLAFFSQNLIKSFPFFRDALVVCGMLLNYYFLFIESKHLKKELDILRTFSPKYFLILVFLMEFILSFWSPLLLMETCEFLVFFLYLFTLLSIQPLFFLFSKKIEKKDKRVLSLGISSLSFIFRIGQENFFPFILAISSIFFILNFLLFTFYNGPRRILLFSLLSLSTHFSLLILIQFLPFIFLKFLLLYALNESFSFFLTKVVSANRIEILENI